MRGEISQRNIVSCLGCARGCERELRVFWSTFAGITGSCGTQPNADVCVRRARRQCMAMLRPESVRRKRNSMCVQLCETGRSTCFLLARRGRGARTKRDETSARWIFDLNRTGTARELCACDVANVRESVRTPKSPSDSILFSLPAQASDLLFSAQFFLPSVAFRSLFDLKFVFSSDLVGACNEQVACAFVRSRRSTTVRLLHLFPPLHSHFSVRHCENHGRPSHKSKRKPFTARIFLFLHFFFFFRRLSRAHQERTNCLSERMYWCGYCATG